MQEGESDSSGAIAANKTPYYPWQRVGMDLFELKG